MVMKEEERERKTANMELFSGLTYSAAVDQESVQKFNVDVNIHRSVYVSECDWGRRAHRLTESALLDLSAVWSAYGYKELSLKKKHLRETSYYFFHFHFIVLRQSCLICNDQICMQGFFFSLLNFLQSYKTLCSFIFWVSTSVCITLGGGEIF